MIRVTQQDNAKAAKSYYTTADYYTEGQEIVGSWGGLGASRLGLSGTVDKFSFERLCDNLDPKTGEPLTVRTRTERTVGYDFTFSVPKSVSLLTWAPPTARESESAHASPSSGRGILVLRNLVSELWIGES